MRTGFEVILTLTGKAEFNLFSPHQLVTFAKNATNEIAVVLMGRIYYQKDLKVNFPQAFQQDFTSDATLVLAIFQNYGVQALQQLEGEFALVVFDSQRSCLFILRDPLGNYPIYWTYCNQSLLVSTNLQLLAQRLPQAKINKNFLASFLGFSFAFVELATEQTAFEKIYRLLPGNFLALNADCTVKNIWSWKWPEKIQPTKNITLEDAAEQFIDLFRQSIQERIQQDHIASHLSGGMDSSSVVCLAREMLETGKLITLSLVYQMRSLAGETQYIQMILDQGGAIEPHYLEGDKALDFQWFDQIIPLHDEPYAGLFHLAMEKILIDIASQLGVTTIFTGGGAELIVEGNRFYLADLVRQGRLQEALKQARLWATANNNSLWSILYQWAILPLIPSLFREGISTLLRKGYGHWPKLGDFIIPPWIVPDFAEKYQMWPMALETIRQLQQFPIENAYNFLGLRSAIGNWASWYLAAPLGIGITQPFLDPRLITYCLSLPRQVKEIPGVTKPLLREAMQGILPEPILTRRLKGNFNEVYWKGLSQNLPLLEKMIEHSQIDELEIFDKQQLIKVMRQHAIGIGDVRSGSHLSRSLAAIAWFAQIKEVLSKKS